jgi:RHS repeat-associated protein
MKLQKGFCFLLRICNGQRWRVQETAGGITTGLYYNRARYLDPATGRWTTPDHLGFAAGDANLYRYVGNRATLATDPSGNLAWFVAVPLVVGVAGFTWLTGSTALVSYRTTGIWWDAGTWGACWDGLRLGIQANVNGLASAARSLLTLGLWNEPWEVWAVDEVDRPYYNDAFLAARFGWELLPTAGIARLTQIPGQIGRWGRWALGWDAGQNAVQAGRGVWDISENGLTWTNGLQVVGSLLGLGGNYTTWRRLPPGGAPATQTGGSRTLQALQELDTQQLAWAERLAAREASVQAMALSRRQALSRLEGLERAVLYLLDEHIPQTIGRSPSSIQHWRAEVGNLLDDMEELANSTNVGRRTTVEWLAKIAEYRRRLAEI